MVTFIKSTSSLHDTTTSTKNEFKNAHQTNYGQHKGLPKNYFTGFLVEQIEFLREEKKQRIFLLIVCLR